MKSIRVFLLASILAILTLFNFVAALQGYQSSLLEAEKLFDSQLLQTAKLIANLYVDNTTSNLKYLSTHAYQVWHDDQLLAASNNAQSEAITDAIPVSVMLILTATDGGHWPTSITITTTGSSQRNELIFDLY